MKRRDHSLLTITYEFDRETLSMFNWLRKDPLKEMNTKYHRLLEMARDLQRNGNIQEFARVTAEADQLLKKIEALEAGKAD